MERFQDENKWLGNFEDEILVKCPKCQSKSSVIKHLKEGCQCGRCTITFFECKECFYKMDEPVYQYIAYGKHYCNNCYEPFEFESMGLKEIPVRYKTKCPHCNFQEECKPKIRKVRRESNFNDGLVREDKYNLPLWFQKEFSGNIFWAYNLDHIDYLQGYIQADLRERNAKVNAFGTMIARLPMFVKAAKNREKLLKILKKWKE